MDARRECVRLVRCVYIGTGLCSGQTFGVTFAYIYPHVWSAPSRGFHALRGSVQMRDRTVVAGDGGGSTRKTWLSEDWVLMACLKPDGDAVRTVCSYAALHLSWRARFAEARQTCLHASATSKPWSLLADERGDFCSSRRHTEWKHPSLYVNGGAGFGGLAWLLALSAPHPFSSVLSSPDIVLCQHFLFLRDIH